jgi:hypothetical protein
MSRTKRISDRFPRFYKNWEKESVVSILIRSISEQLDKAEEGITDLMKAHWVDTASDAELDKLGNLVGSRRMPDEDGEHLRGRLKRAVDEYKGGGTVSVIREQIKELTGAKSGKGIEIIENPIAEASAEFAVIANDTWTLGSNSIEDENPNLYLTVEGKGEVSNPQITNMGTGQSITFKGKLKTGEQLIMKQNIALLGEEDVTGNVSPQEPPRLLRRGSSWKYSESLSERIGVFDTGKFDEHTFAVGVPTVKVRFEWMRRQPATFTIQIKSRTLRDSGLAEPYLEKAASLMKAAGVNAIIKVME